MARKISDITSWGVDAVALAHLFDGVGKQALAIEDVGVFGKEAEHQPRP